jgi:hypothetical protein
MKKLTTLLSAVALVTTLALAGCKKDKKPEGEPAPAPTEPAKTEPAKTDPAPAPAGGSAAAPAADPAAAPAAGGGGSVGVAECDEYLKAVEKYAACDKLPAQAKEATLKAADTMKQGWTANMPEEAKKAAADGCKQATDALKQSASAMQCTI